MKTAILLLIVCLVLPLQAQTKRKSLLDSDPDVVYLDKAVKKPVELKVIKDAPVFSDKGGKYKIGTLKSNLTVKVEAITDKVYRVRAQGTRDAVAGWVAPWAFSSADPEFVSHLKQLYERQMQVQALIKEKQVAVGMTLEEVSESRGKPTKTNLRKTDKGQTGRWEFIDYEEQKNYITRVDPVSGAAYRQLVSVTQIEKSKTAIEFENDVVTAIEETEDHNRGGNVRIVVPPLVFGW